MKRELIQNTKLIPIDPSAETEAIDRTGFLSAVIAVVAKGSGELKLTVKHSDTAEGDFTEVVDNYLFVDGTGAVKDAAADDLVNFDADLAGCKPFIKISFTGNGLGSGGLGAIVLGDPGAAPIEASENLGE